METIKKKKPVNWWSVAFILCATIIPIAQWLIFYVYMNFNSFLMAFQTETPTGIKWGFDNFKMFFEEFSLSTSLIRQAFKNTALSFGVHMISYVTGFLVSFFLYKKIFLHKLWRIVFFLPTVIAGTVVSSIFSYIVSVDGPIAPVVQSMMNLDYLPDLLHDSDYANSVIFSHMLIFGFASNMILWGGAFSRIPGDVVEAGKLDGLNWWREIIYITIPLVWPTFTLTLILNLCSFFGSTGQVFLLTKGNYGTMTLSCWMYLQVYEKAEQQNALNYMSAVGMLLTSVSIVISLIVRKITNSSSFAKLQF